MINKTAIQKISDQEMDRKAFLKYSGLILVGLVGLRGVVALLNGDAKQITYQQPETLNASPRRFGSSKYGAQIVVQQRLPAVNGDDGAWGDILNQFLSKEHYNTGADNAANGGHKTITVQAGANGAGTAPLKFTSGSLMTTPEAGAVEFLTDKLYYTTTAPTRMTVAAYPASTGATGDVYYRSSTGGLTVLPVGSDTYVLTLASGLPTWAPAAGGGSGLTQAQILARQSIGF